MSDERLNITKQRMNEAERMLRDFIERSNRTFSVEELRQHGELAERLTQVIREHLEALLEDRRVLVQFRFALFR